MTRKRNLENSACYSVTRGLNVPEQQNGPSNSIISKLCLAHFWLCVAEFLPLLICTIRALTSACCSRALRFKSRQRQKFFKKNINYLLCVRKKEISAIRRSAQKSMEQAQTKRSTSATFSQRSGLSTSDTRGEERRDCHALPPL